MGAYEALHRIVHRQDNTTLDDDVDVDEDLDLGWVHRV
jgi:hypothetical protein